MKAMDNVTILRTTYEDLLYECKQDLKLALDLNNRDISYAITLNKDLKTVRTLVHNVRRVIVLDNEIVITKIGPLINANECNINRDEFFTDTLEKLGLLDGVKELLHDRYRNEFRSICRVYHWYDIVEREYLRYCKDLRLQELDRNAKTYIDYGLDNLGIKANNEYTQEEIDDLPF